MGRPKITDEASRKLNLTITLTKEHISLLKKIGKGNSSEGVRTLLENVHELPLRTEADK